MIGDKMLDWYKIKEYIEKKNNIKLTSNQTQILKAVIRGDVIYTARGCGRSLIYNGYADYLKEVVAKDTDRSILPEEFDSIFTVDTLMKDIINFKHGGEFSFLNKIKEKNPQMFKKDFMCEYTK